MRRNQRNGNIKRVSAFYTKEEKDEKKTLLKKSDKTKNAYIVSDVGRYVEAYKTSSNITEDSYFLPDTYVINVLPKIFTKTMLKRLAEVMRNLNTNEIGSYVKSSKSVVSFFDTKNYPCILINNNTLRFEFPPIELKGIIGTSKNWISFLYNESALNDNCYPVFNNPLLKKLFRLIEEIPLLCQKNTRGCLLNKDNEEFVDALKNVLSIKLTNEKYNAYKKRVENKNKKLDKPNEDLNSLFEKERSSVKYDAFLCIDEIEQKYGTIIYKNILKYFKKSTSQSEKDRIRGLGFIHDLIPRVITTKLIQQYYHFLYDDVEMRLFPDPNKKYKKDTTKKGGFRGKLDIVLSFEETNRLLTYYGVMSYSLDVYWSFFKGNNVASRSRIEKITPKNNEDRRRLEINTVIEQSNLIESLNKLSKRIKK